MEMAFSKQAALNARIDAELAPIKAPPKRIDTCKVEYRTTSEPWSEAFEEKIAGHWCNFDADVPDPVAPEGGGWLMTGSTATNGRLFWFWKRESETGDANDG